MKTTNYFISRENNLLSYPSLPGFYALLEGFFEDISQLLHYDSLDCLTPNKISSLDDFLELGVKEHLMRKKIR